MEASKVVSYISDKYGLVDQIPTATFKNPVSITGVERDSLAELFSELGYKTGAEIGVEQGAYSKVLLSRNPGLKLFCVDAWARYSKYRDHVDQEKLDGFYKKTEERLRNYDAVLVRAFSADAAKQFKPGSLDFVYIDANHSIPYVINDIWMWGEKVRSGGIIAGHDFIQYKKENIQCHVVHAVYAWALSYRISPWFVMGGGMKKGEKEEDSNRARSWFWVKP